MKFTQGFEESIDVHDNWALKPTSGIEALYYELTKFP